MRFIARLSPLIAMSVLVLVGHVFGADERFAGLDEYVSAAMKRWEVPGLAMAVVKEGEIVLARGYGVCEVGRDRKVTKDSIFPIASCSKSFTAACVALLVDEGKLRWDDPVIKCQWCDGQARRLGQGRKGPRLRAPEEMI